MKTLLPAVTLILGVVLAPTAFAQAFVSVQIAPPPLPVYEQPLAPGPDYLWTPGYWAYSAADGGYFWVPGTWVLAPQPGYLWTPGYWAFNSGFYVWRPGYWGATVGFYGGIDYGYGYTGSGYYGGYWRDRHFYYNRAVNNVNVAIIHNTYRRTVVHRSVNHISYNGGHGGVSARPGADHGRSHGPRVGPTRDQEHQRDMARGNHAQFDRVNRGRPGVAATPRSGAFTGHGVTHGGGHAARAPNRAPADHATRRTTAPGSTPRSPAQHHAVKPQHPQVQQPAPAQHRAQGHVQAPSRPQVQHRQAPAHRAPQHAAPVRRPAPQRQAPHPAPQQHRPAPRGGGHGSDHGGDHHH